MRSWFRCGCIFRTALGSPMLFHQQAVRLWSGACRIPTLSLCWWWLLSLQSLISRTLRPNVILLLLLIRWLPNNLLTVMQIWHFQERWVSAEHISHACYDCLFLQSIRLVSLVQVHLELFVSESIFVVHHLQLLKRQVTIIPLRAWHRWITDQSIIFLIRIFGLVCAIFEVKLVDALFNDRHDGFFQKVGLVDCWKAGLRLDGGMLLAEAIAEETLTVHLLPRSLSLPLHLKVWQVFELLSRSCNLVV